MSTLADLLAAHTGLSDEQGGHLQRLVGEWQLLADLSFADLLLTVPDAAAANTAFLTVAQCRPNTAATVLPGDEVTNVADDQLTRALRSAAERGEITVDRGAAPGGVEVRRELIPVRFDGEVVAVLIQAAADTAQRVPSPLERSYQASAADLCHMVADGTFPVVEGNESGLSTPRAGDGYVRVDADGLVRYASPNALSAFHRMGFTSDLSGVVLADVFTELVTDAFDAQDAAQMITLAASGPALDPAAADRVLRMEVDARRATVLVRAVPLRPRGVATGAIVLVRDVTEVKRRDRALISKDATIREIHHRVKNNLQSVSALLRLQARRTANPDAQSALNEAVRRVASIALVHEFLSGSVDEEVDVDEVVHRLLPVLVDATSAGAPRAEVQVYGRFGVLSADLAMPLVMVLTELIQNSVEHGFADGRQGRIEVHAQRGLRDLVIQVSDNGAGIPQGFDPGDSGNLGLQIVRTLVEIDLNGTVEFAGADGGGTAVRITIPIAVAADARV
ncbi:MAG: histidine kinase N-terminal domain-containing protein [Gordonia sp. (in: high G+C Gram-positive bacteria)]|uniref:sensor histidine kinase n=1 Tax=Gordonia sp. (in: high G+C Gram-positive bacteria) TaxID=84139 RepID=UPI0039E58D20